MKKLLLIAVGLGLATQAEAKMNVSLESATDLIKAVQDFPENLEKIQKKSIGVTPGEIEKDEQSLEAFTNSLGKNLKTVADYKVGGTIENKGKKYTITSKTGALLKLTGITLILDDVVKFLQYSLDINAIITNDMILPILNVAGQQSLLDPLNKISSQIEKFKNELSNVNTQVKDIMDLVKLLS